jgi:putative phosphoribosyl transferase
MDNLWARHTTKSKIFDNRRQAGRQLSFLLKKYQSLDPIIFAIARGGVEVAYEVARALNVPMEVLVVRKLGSPQNSELGVGAISESGVVEIDSNALDSLGISREKIKSVYRQEKKELSRRIRLYRQGKRLPSLLGKTVILIDDGLASGVTANAAITTLKSLNPRYLIFGVPIAAYESTVSIGKRVDDLICIDSISGLRAISLYYHDFKPTSDQMVAELLKKTKRLESSAHYH